MFRVLDAHADPALLSEVVYLQNCGSTMLRIDHLCTVRKCCHDACSFETCRCDFGSCNALAAVTSFESRGAGQFGKVAYNWKIILAPKRLVEYVVAHEVCHLKHDDHSKEFWRLLERAMPDYERRRLELAVNGPKYDIIGGM